MFFYEVVKYEQERKDFKETVRANALRTYSGAYPKALWVCTVKHNVVDYNSSYQIDVYIYIYICDFIYLLYCWHSYSILKILNHYYYLYTWRLAKVTINNKTVQKKCIRQFCLTAFAFPSNSESFDRPISPNVVSQLSISVQYGPVKFKTRNTSPKIAISIDRIYRCLLFLLS